MIGAPANIGAALCFDALNGVHDAPNATAALIGTQTLNRRQAIAWATLWTFVPAFVVSTGVAATVGKGLVETTALTPPVIFSGLTSAVGWGLFTWLGAKKLGFRGGIPSSSTYALIGGLAGAAIFNSVYEHGFGAFFDPLIRDGWINYVGWMFAAPVVSFAATKGLTWAPVAGRAVQRAFTTHAPNLSRYIAISYDKSKTASACLTKPIQPLFKAAGAAINRRAISAWEKTDDALLIPIEKAYHSASTPIKKSYRLARKKMQDVGYAFFPSLQPVFAGADAISVPYEAEIVETKRESSQLFQGTTQQWSQLGASAALSAAHSGNDAMKTAGVITAVLRDADPLAPFEVSFFIVLASFTTMTLGTALGGGRIERTLSEGMGEKMRPADGIRSQLVAAAGVAAASDFHQPISTTLVLTAATAGTNGNLDRNVVKKILLRWGSTIPAAATGGAAIMAFLTYAGMAEHHKIATPAKVDKTITTTEIGSRNIPLPFDFAQNKLASSCGIMAKSASQQSQPLSPTTPINGPYSQKLVNVNFRREI